jgi:hypothetical protein
MKRNLIACLCVALVLRVLFVVFVFPEAASRWQLREDGDHYGELAQTIRDGRWTDVVIGPVYPLFVAVARAPMTVKLAQAVVDVLTGLLVFQLSRRRMLAMWLWALYPFAIWRVAFINKETALTFLFAAYVCAQVAAVRDGKHWQWILAGALLGLVNLCKPMYLLWPLVLAWFVSRATAKSALALLAMALVIAPWTWRNYRVSGGDFIPVGTQQGGVTTFVGNYQPNAGMWEGDGKTNWMMAVAEIRAQHPNATPSELDRVFYREAWKQIAADPVNALAIYVRKLGRFWFLSSAQRVPLGSILIQGVYLALAVFGFWRLRPWRAEEYWLVSIVVAAMCIHAVGVSEIRFCLPVMPIVCALAVGMRKLDRDNLARV